LVLDKIDKTTITPQKKAVPIARRGVLNGTFKQSAPAAKMPQVAGDTRKARANLLREAGNTARRRYFESLIGKTVEVLAEERHSGHSPHYAPVKLNRETEAGRLVEAVVSGTNDDGLVAGGTA